jgi:hypothetical protein
VKRERKGEEERKKERKKEEERDRRMKTVTPLTHIQPSGRGRRRKKNNKTKLSGSSWDFCYT